MKSLSTATAAAFDAPAQRPGILVEAGFSTTERWCSHATITWAGHTWVGTDVRAEGLAVAALSIQGALILGNVDGVAGALVLAEGVQDRRFRVWAFDAAATGSSDPVWLCDAVGASAQVDDTSVRITLRHRTEYTVSPRTRVTPEAGFASLVPAGTVLRINGIDYRLDRP